jgi:hypothetical protein
MIFIGLNRLMRETIGTSEQAETINTGGKEVCPALLLGSLVSCPLEYGKNLPDLPRNSAMLTA